ncbi:MAG TPA: hypothetical protein VGK67_19395 [Myxococcales bacterium]|jgi:hypothetical protein
MRSYTAILVAVLFALLSGCNCGVPVESSVQDASVPACDPGCQAGFTCEAASLTCVKALREGQVCEKDAEGKPVEGACEQGLACGVVGTLKRCSKDCTSADGARICGAARQCFSRPGGSGSSNGFCGTAAAEGQPCGDIELLKCTGGSLVCINAGGDTLGQCFKVCDPTTADPNPDCAQGQSCADLFPSDPTRGVCLVPAGSFPTKCDYATLAYCGRGEACVRPGDESWGYCHDRCSAPADCTGGLVCATPSTGLEICVAAVARCEGADPSTCAECTATKDEYCGPEDVCVRLTQASTEYLVCKQDCTATKTCAKGACSALTGTDRFACLE